MSDQLKKKKSSTKPNRNKIVNKVKVAKSKTKVRKQLKKPNSRKETIIPMPVLSTEKHPQLVLQTVYFLNDNHSKYLYFGYDPWCSFQVTIVLASNTSFVRMGVSDWLTLILNITEAYAWFDKHTDDKFGEFKTTKNIKISKFLNGTDHLLEVQNCPRFRTNNNTFLSRDEFTRCIQLDSCFNSSLKQMQLNPQLLDDYFNWYVYHCSVAKKMELDESDFFLPFGNVSSFDSCRLFKEIPIFCKQKLDADLALVYSE